MEWENNLRRAESLKSVHSSYDRPSWTEAGLKRRTTSVSELVSRYQTTVVVTTSVQETMVNNVEVKPKQMIKETSPSKLETLIHRNEERERSRAKTNLTRSKSMGSLQKTTASIGTLKALFESKAATRNDSKSNFRATSFTPAYKAAESTPVMNGGMEEVKKSAEEQKAKRPPDVQTNDTKTDGKDHVTRKVSDQEAAKTRRRTISGIDFEKLAASQADEKRRSLADFRENKEKLSISVKAMSALYQSKVAPQGSNRSLQQQAQDKSSEPGKKAKQTKFLPSIQEMCSACSKPVYPMEKITTDKYTFHKTCFCCKQCKKILSMQNYAPLYGEFYCIFHYKQLFRRKGNYDEGFGYAQHKNRWLLKNTSDESEA